MKVIIAGSRECTNYEYVRNKLLELFTFPYVTEVVSGTARGVDLMGEEWAKEEGIVIKKFPADWNQHGRGSGYMRNKEMAEYSDVLVAFWDGYSKGTKHMIDLALEQKLETHIYFLGE